jgi:VanZ family protein
LTPEKKEVLKVWIAAGLWLVVIAIESTSMLSAANTGRFLYPILHYLFGITPAQFRIWHIVIRKGGHVVGYFILSVLLFRAWRLTLPVGRLQVWAMRWAAAAFFMSALVASLDEWHQSFLPSRTGRVTDVLLDSSAALLALVFMYWRRNGRQAATIENL